MIKRIWHGWTSLENADAYKSLLLNEIFFNIETRKINGFRGIELIKKESGNEVEFVTIMNFEDLDAVKEFAGKNYETAVVPEKAQRLLLRYDGISRHYELIHSVSL